MPELYINAIAVATDGMPGWNVAREVLSGRQAYRPQPLDRYKPVLLPPNERRRATNLVRLAFRVCEEIVNTHPEAAHETLPVFASSGGDYQIIDQICRVLREDNRALSPTQFHNSVHNAAAGYWSIATQSRLPSTSLSCYDHTFAAGLLEAAAVSAEAGRAVLLAAYDTELPQPLLNKRPVALPFAAAMLLTPRRALDTLAGITIRHGDKAPESRCKIPDMERLRCSNPAARALPLLELIAGRRSGTVVLDLPGDASMRLDVEC